MFSFETINYQSKSGFNKTDKYGKHDPND